MDEVDEEVTAVDAAEATHLQSKETEYSVKPNSCNILEPREMVIPGESGYPSSSHEVFSDIFDGKNLSRNASGLAESEHPYASPHSMDSVGIVEELTLRNYNSAKLAVVASNNRERTQTRQNQWLGGGSGIGGSIGDVYRDNGQVSSAQSQWEDMEHMSLPEFLAQKPSSHNHNEIVGQLENNEHRAVSAHTFPPGGIRTKILSKSGFSEFFIKNTLKGKGIIRRGPTQDSTGVELRGQNNAKAAGVNVMVSDASMNSSAKAMRPCPHGVTGFGHGPDSSTDGVSLREWLKSGRHKVKKVDCLYIFRQILDFVDLSHSQGLALQDLRPSYLKLLPSNQVKYLGSCIHGEIMGSVVDQDIPQSEDHVIGKRPVEWGLFPSVSSCTKRQKLTELTNIIRWQPPLPSRPSFKLEAGKFLADTNGVAHRTFGHGTNDEHSPNPGFKTQSKCSSPCMSNTAQQRLILESDQLEKKWYTSPEDISKRSSALSANIYQLGVLLFELLGSFNTERSHVSAMSDLHHRILPRHFLSEYPREAGFCLWLLHPEPSSRPMTKEILHSEVISGLQEVFGDELSSSIDQDDVESELLLHFLLSMKEQEQKHAFKLVEDIRCLEDDIEEVGRRHLSKKSLFFSSSQRDHNSGRESILPSEKIPSLEAPSVSFLSSTNDLRLKKNMSQLESAYFSMRSKVQLPVFDDTARSDKDLLMNQENSDTREKPNDRLGAFFDGLCKYARYSKFEVRGILRTGDFISSANVICSLSFDRDEDYFAAAGVSKKIKIFDFHALFNDSVDIHYPVVEMLNRSRLSCVCWNYYIKNYLASTDYEGIVKLWDAGTGQGFSQYIEHQKRAWSVDFSRVDPTKLASGSDDYSVKLWSINERNCLGTIRNAANVCSVQFSAHSTHLLAFGSADYKTYCYDLRNAKTPWCILAGHDKAVSYVKFLDSETLVSASTDNTLKLWDLNKTSPSGLSTNACCLTLRGHTNEKNFVGLSVADGYVACGSETNEVYAYHRSMPMPITSYKFGSIDPISGKETDDDNGQFVSSVCWRERSDMVVAANSTGCMKVLQAI
ncbi:protein SPA1-RELATED 2-like isoform X2 [Malania oleifera]|uniref:protein SPA1-RELATED 2-like isoform X2 n=1 Tax=Malania oleifera TaxID=397392 RepID=UPI0025ADCD75|nr:protein SPA1-RELATED 2-like isoform X2 [Malania oleifera]